MTTETTSVLITGIPKSCNVMPLYEAIFDLARKHNLAFSGLFKPGVDQQTWELKAKPTKGSKVVHLKPRKTHSDNTLPPAA
jgi:hypothetical protein